MDWKSAVKFLCRPDQISGILYTGRLIGRVHGKLRETDVGGIEGYLRIGVEPPGMSDRLTNVCTGTPASRQRSRNMAAEIPSVQYF